MQRQIRRPIGRDLEIPVTAQAVQRQIAWAAGTEYFAHRDPVAHVTEDFRQTFDAIGRQHAAALAGETVGGFREFADQPQDPLGTQREGRLPDPTDARSFYETRPDQQDFIRRFSETAFQRGTLSGAVMAGTGRMMLVSCLKRTVGQSQPLHTQQRKLFGGMAQRGVPGHGSDGVIFHRGMADSAVGLVVDTLRAARRTVDSMTDLARGRSSMGSAGGAHTLRRMYPFLDDSREQALLTRYRARLQDCADPQERQLLQRAIVQLRALVDKKTQMKQNFIDKLQQISDRATEALTLFEAPGFAQTLVQEVLETEDEPPDGAGEEDGRAADQSDPREGGGAGRQTGR